MTALLSLWLARFRTDPVRTQYGYFSWQISDRPVPCVCSPHFDFYFSFHWFLWIFISLTIYTDMHPIVRVGCLCKACHRYFFNFYQIIILLQRQLDRPWIYGTDLWQNNASLSVVSARVLAVNLEGCLSGPALFYSNKSRASLLGQQTRDDTLIFIKRAH